MAATGTKQAIAEARVWIARQRGQEPTLWDLLDAGEWAYPTTPARHWCKPGDRCVCGERTTCCDQAERVMPNGEHVLTHAECYTEWPLA
jgi:hypothetical protein